MKPGTVTGSGDITNSDGSKEGNTWVSTYDGTTSKNDPENSSNPYK